MHVLQITKSAVFVPCLYKVTFWGFKNKKVTIKSIEWEEDGDLVINGRPALKFRMTKDDVNEKLDYKRALRKLKIPPRLLNNKIKLTNYLTANPQILTQLLRLIGEDINEDVNVKTPKVLEENINQLEEEIDQYNKNLPSLNVFLHKI